MSYRSNGPILLVTVLAGVMLLAGCGRSGPRPRPYQDAHEGGDRRGRGHAGTGGMQEPAAQEPAVQQPAAQEPAAQEQPTDPPATATPARGGHHHRHRIEHSQRPHPRTTPWCAWSTRACG
ncbi:MAG: hypothetical protein R2838_17970 [Caldilineaceae bacterium]